jgi:hypothetical protein
LPINDEKITLLLLIEETKGVYPIAKPLLMKSSESPFKAPREKRNLKLLLIPEKLKLPNFFPMIYNIGKEQAQEEKDENSGEEDVEENLLTLPPIPQINETPSMQSAPFSFLMLMIGDKMFLRIVSLFSLLMYRPPVVSRIPIQPIKVGGLCSKIIVEIVTKTGTKESIGIETERGESFKPFIYKIDHAGREINDPYANSGQNNGWMLGMPK